MPDVGPDRQEETVPGAEQVQRPLKRCWWPQLQISTRSATAMPEGSRKSSPNCYSAIDLVPSGFARPWSGDWLVEQ